MSISELTAAINNVYRNIKEDEKRKQIDLTLFVNNCIKEFNILKLPFYSIALNKDKIPEIIIETPFTTQSSIKIEQYVFGSEDKAAILYVNNKAVRKVKLEEKSPEYMKQIAHGLIDYFTRYLLLKNKFKD